VPESARLGYKGAEEIEGENNHGVRELQLGRGASKKTSKRKRKEGVFY